MDWEETCQERLDEDIVGHFGEAEVEALLLYIEERKPGLFQEVLNEWLVTKVGRKWYEDKLEAMINSAPDMEPEDLPGAER